MNGPVAVGFLHTAAAHVATFDRLVAEQDGPVARHHVDLALLRAAVADPSLPVLAAEVRAAVARLVEQGAGVVVCTCSTLGPLAESVDAAVPVVRVDRPMAAAAVRAGRRVGVVAALASTVGPTTDLLREEAGRAGVEVELELELRLVDEAWAAWEAGDRTSYDAQVAAAARALADRVDVVVLAQASMLGALEHLPDLRERVLVGPPAAVRAALGLLR